MSEVPFDQPGNPWIYTQGLSSAQCQLDPYDRVDLLLRKTPNRLLYVTNIDAVFLPTDKTPYVIGYRRHLTVSAKRSIAPSLEHMAA